MPKTPASSQTSYLPASEFLNRVDPRLVAQLVSVTTVPYATSGNPPVIDMNALAANARLQACLLDASGDVESACFIGEAYTADDLQNLSGAGLAKLYRIITDRTWAYLIELRPELQMAELPSMQRSEAWLDALTEGKRIFAFVETADAGLLTADPDTPNDVQARRGITYDLRRGFGRRIKRKWPF